MTEIRLGGYPAKKCPRVTHNANSPASPAPLPVGEDLQRLFDGGNEFEAEVNAAFAEAFGADALLLDEAATGWNANIEATMKAMGDGVPLIINGRLPAIDGRVGAPDVLVLVEGGYLPVDVKHHGTFGRQKTRTLTYSSFGDPATRLLEPGRSGDGTHRVNDCAQLAHYTRMLQALGHHPVASDSEAPLWGGIIGSSDFGELTGDRWGIVWYDLTVPTEVTYSASAEGHRKKRSPMERYDHEFAFRLDVARIAREGGELVVPIGTSECFACEWQEYCAEVAGPEDPSFAFTTGRLSVREWQFLRGHGGDTLDGLAGLDADALVEDFAQQAVNGRGVRERLEAAIRRARMIRDDIDIEPIAAWPAVPAAEVEIDFDIEWDTSLRIYQWGIRVRQGQDDATAVYDPVVSFDPLDDDAESALAALCADRIRQIVASATSARKSVAIYHWSHVELSRTKRFADLASVLDEYAVDLHGWVKQNFWVRGSYSIKDVAPLFGFGWGLDDAGGFASMRMVDEARRPGVDGEPARAWCLAYNEADTAAQAAIRDGLRALATNNQRGNP